MLISDDRGQYTLSQLKRTDGGDSKQLKGPPSVVVSTHASHALPQTSPLSAKTISKILSLVGDSRPCNFGAENGTSGLSGFWVVRTAKEWMVIKYRQSLETKR